MSIRNYSYSELKKVQDPRLQVLKPDGRLFGSCCFASRNLIVLACLASAKPRKIGLGSNGSKDRKDRRGVCKFTDGGPET